MANKDHIDNFVKLENAASNLIHEMEQLRAEVGGYGDARKSLHNVSTGLVAATKKYETLASQFEDVAKAMREVGMPEVLRSLNDLKTLVTESTAEVNQLMAATATQQESRMGSLAKLALAGISLLALLVVVAMFVPSSPH